MNFLSHKGHVSVSVAQGGGASAYTNASSVLFTANGSRAQIPNSAFDWSTYTEFTFVAWFKSTSTGVHAIISSYDLPGDEQFIWALRGDIGGNMVLYTHDGAALDEYRSATSGYNDGNWHHAAVTWKANTAPSLYIDGVSLAGSYSTGGPIASFATATTSPPTLIGAANDNSPTNQMVGNIDEVAIFNTQLTGAQIADIYNSGSPKAITGAVSWYRMGDDDTYPTLTDNIGSNDATLVGSTTTAIEADVP